MLHWSASRSLRFAEFFRIAGEAANGGRLIVFGSFQFDLAASVLHRRGSPVGIGRRGAAILAALLSRRGEVLTKEELLDAAWPGEIVEQSNLTVQIALLRKQIGSPVTGGSWITTVERVGYRFLPGDTDAAEQNLASLPTVQVQPFEDISGEKVSTQFADWLFEDLQNELTGVSSLVIVAPLASSLPQGRLRPTSMVAYQTGASFVVEGTVRRMEDGFQITARLLDGASGVYLCAHSVDTPDGFSMPSKYASRRLAAWVVSEVEAAEIRRSRDERPNGTSSRDLYLRARFLMQASRREGHAAAYALLVQAMRLEPENVTIVAAACEALHHTIGCGWPQLTANDRTEWIELSNRGLLLGGGDATALGLIANTLFSAQEPDLGAAVFQRAVETNPTSSLALVSAGLCNLYLGRHETAEQYYERVLELGPSDPSRKFALTQLAHVARRRGDYESAIDLSTRSLAVNQGLTATYWNLISCNALLGRMRPPSGTSPCTRPSPQG